MMRTLPLASTATVWRKLRELFGGHYAELAVVVILQTIVAITAVVAPSIIGRAIDAVMAGTSTHVVKVYFVVLLVAVVCQAVFSYFGEYAGLKLGETLFARLREGLVDRITHLPLSVAENVGTGELLGRSTHDVARVSLFLQRGISILTSSVLAVVATVVASLLASPVLGLAVVLPLLPLYSITTWYLRHTIPAYHAATAVWAEISGTVSESVEQYETVDASGMGRLKIARLDALVKEFWRNETYTSWMRAYFMTLISFTVTAPLVISVLCGVFFYAHGWVSVGEIAAVALLVQQLRRPLLHLGFLLDEFQFALVSFSRIFGVEELVDTDSDDVSPVDEHANETSSAYAVARAQNTAGSAVNVHGVTFSYVEGRPVLHGVSIDLPAGASLAIVGPSGSGKSTLGRLIAGINPPDEGAIFVGGTRVVDIPEGQRHRTVALVTQEQHVFVGTVAENLLLAKPDASEAELWESLEVLGAAGWVRELPEGMEEKIGSGGYKLSPAQVQQLALARIVLINPAVVVLDEATSLLDQRAARDMERGLARLLEGRTVISIAHRLYTAHDADFVAVMKAGNVVEYGSHDELLALGGEYARLWEAWQG